MRMMFEKSHLSAVVKSAYMPRRLGAINRNTRATPKQQHARYLQLAVPAILISDNARPIICWPPGGKNANLGRRAFQRRLRR